MRANDEQTVMLFVYVNFIDDTLNDSFEKTAPSLPPGITWHKGLMYEIEGYEKAVKEISVCSDGTWAAVWLEDINVIDMPQMSDAKVVLWLHGLGWK